MARLPEPPDLDWSDGQTPRDRRHGDVYFSTANGLAETRAVFLAGCGLPDAWAGRDTFTIAETGFGTGLNFLAAWQLWQADGPPGGWLNFVSFEASPMLRRDAARALAAFPELDALARALLACWPERAWSTQRFVWPQARLSLTLHVADVIEGLESAWFRADAWFLDGFSPASNPAMWSRPLYARMAELSAPDARVASFTVAGQVRRGLAAAGFSVRKCAGHGAKRERLEARFTGAAPGTPDSLGLRPANGPAPVRIAILGAGIAGAALARTLSERGACVSVFDPAPAPAQGASGNPLALVMPRLDVGDTPAARVMLEAYLAACRAYLGRPGVSEVSVRQLPRNARDADRFARLVADPPLAGDRLAPRPEGGLEHKRALILEPRKLVADLLSGLHLRLGRAAELDLNQRRVDGEAFDAIILASGMALDPLAPWLGLVARKGQVEHVKGQPWCAPDAVAGGPYGLALRDQRLWGATFEPHSGGAVEPDAEARARNWSSLQALAPDWLGDVASADVMSRAGVRATTPDRLPLAGPLPDLDAARRRFAGLAAGRRVDADAPRIDGVWICGGLGSRGFTLAPWLAGLICAQMFADPAPAGDGLRGAVSPMRVILRGLKRATPAITGKAG